MSVWKEKGRKVYRYDFRLAGHRFQGSTGQTERRAAEREEQRVREEQRALIAEGRGPRRRMTLSAAAHRYMEEAGGFQAAAETLDWAYERLIEDLGAATFLDEIDDAAVARLVASRRRETTGPAHAPRPVSNFHVNRWTVIPLRRLMNYAAKTWKAETGEPVDWRAHLLAEPKGRVRELGAAEERRLFEALREDYHAIVEFSLITGVRLENAVGLEWSHIRHDAHEIRFEGKGETGARVLHTIPLTPAILAILQRCRPHSTGPHVFTYEAQRTRIDKRTGKKYVRGRRYAINRWSLRRAWTTAKKRAGLEDLRWHDLRHTAASRALRASGNLAVTQKLLGHARIETTVKYAHAQREDVRDALQAVARGAGRRPESPHKVPHGDPDPPAKPLKKKEN